MTPNRLILVACIALFGGAACGPSLDCKSPGDICTVAGSGVEGFGGDNGPALLADLYFPQDLTFGPDGNAYILDWNNHRIRKLAKDGKMSTVAGSGGLGDGPPGPALESDFNHPTNIAFDRQGRMVIAAWHNSRIKRVDLATGMLEDVAGTGRRAYSGENGPAGRADLDLPAGIAFDSEDNLLMMDQANQMIRKISPDGIISRFAGQCITGQCQPGQVPVACPGASNKSTCSLAIDPEACGRPCAPSFGGDNGPADLIRIAQPFGQAADPAGRIALDAAGNLLFADSNNHRIRKIDSTRMVTTIAGTGTPGTSGDGGPAALAQLFQPTDLAIADDGLIYVADTYNSCIRSISPDGTIQTVVGTCGSRGFSGDGGSAKKALLDRPYGIALDSHGALYIADTYNNRIRMVRR